jgi:3-mercaptopyruvate sulfurtransferase SseA
MLRMWLRSIVGQPSTERIDSVAGHIPGADNLYWQSQFDSQGTFDSAQLYVGSWSEWSRQHRPLAAG